MPSILGGITRTRTTTRTTTRTFGPLYISAQRAYRNKGDSLLINIIIRNQTQQNDYTYSSTLVTKKANYIEVIT